MQLVGTDESGIERDVVFEYELHFNFTFERDISDKFCAIKLPNGQYIGLYFATEADQTAFSDKLAEV